MPGLDVMRGLAILLVLVYHSVFSHVDAIFSSGIGLPIVLLRLLSMARLGVNLFFILSGFLITGILLDSRGDRDYFRNFYLRRVLRIVPAYLLLLLVLLLTRSIDRRYLVLCLLYLCNMTGAFHSTSEYGSLWSLSVEEQFYVVWPLVVWKISRRSLAWLSLLIILGTPALRLALLHGPAPLHDIATKTWAVMDFFAAGALMSLAIRSVRLRAALPSTVMPLLVGGFALTVLHFWMPQPPSGMLQNLWLATFLEPWLLIFSGLVLWAYLRPNIASATWAKPLIFLARISYSLYLYHIFIFALVIRFWPAGLAGRLPPVTNALLESLIGIGLSIAAAYVSRNTLEEFFLRLKPKHHPVRVPREAATKIT
jgi:peptidoglycan/LPS O-acetylase OafA/YrhL